MDLVIELTENDVGIEGTPEKPAYTIRKAARAVLFNKENKIAYLHVSKHGYHKLPGGGLEPGEDIPTALKREVMEETGCNLEINDPIGASIEYKAQQGKVQVSYCFFAEVAGDSQEPDFTEKEKSDGFRLMWVDIDEAISTLEKDHTDDYTGKFISSRDLAFLKKARELR
jgi:ADP-ribose pyrophosphatase YjhB (NUDIX family)